MEVSQYVKESAYSAFHAGARAAGYHARIYTL